MRAVIVTIDAAKCSGVATYIDGQLHHYCEVKVQDGPARRRVMRDAITMAEVRGMPVACVLEVPWGGRVSAALSLTETVGLWRDTWRGLGRREHHMLEFTANEWRRALFGQTGMPRAQVRRLEAEVALRTAERDMPAKRHYTIGGDAAAAICIGQVVIRSGAVASALGLSSNTGRRHTV
jgi:hypothetical protein